MNVARFSGNQHNPDWSWIYDKLCLLKVETLAEIYRRTEFDTQKVFINQNELTKPYISTKGTAAALRFLYTTGTI